MAAGEIDPRPGSCERVQAGEATRNKGGSSVSLNLFQIASHAGEQAPPVNFLLLLLVFCVFLSRQLPVQVHTVMEVHFEDTSMCLRQNQRQAGPPRAKRLYNHSCSVEAKFLLIVELILFKKKKNNRNFECQPKKFVPALQHSFPAGRSEVRLQDYEDKTCINQFGFIATCR